MHILLAFLMALTLTAPVAAAVPQRINFQGRLTDSGGNPVSGTKSITFSIWDAASAGSQLWSEARSVSVSSGIYNVALGEVTALSSAVFAGPERWLQLQVDTDPAMTPRIKLQSVAYALRAERAGGLSGVSGSDVAVATASGLSVTGTVTASGFSGSGAGLTDLPSSSLLFPGGLQGLTPVWTTVSPGNNYTVPAGKNLYIHHILQPQAGPWGPVQFDGIDAPDQAVLAGAGTVVTSTVATTTIGGYLLPATVTVVLMKLAPGASYVVPAGSIFVAFTLPAGLSINGSEPLAGNYVTFLGLAPFPIGPGMSVTNSDSIDRYINGYLRPQ